MIKLNNIEDVVQYQLCTGCGVCAALEPKRYSIVDEEEFGRRPTLVNNPAAETGRGFAACPGHALEHSYTSNAGLIKELEDCWGPVIEVWEGYAADEKIRFKGSSGGAATALSTFAIESRVAKRVIQTSADAEKPYRNKTVINTTTTDILKSAGSRYAPSSPCEALEEDPELSSTTMFVGKPCDVAAATKWEQQTGLTIPLKIAFFCAGVPSTQGNLSLIKSQGLNYQFLKSLKYRGNGWPGLWEAKDTDVSSSLTYADSWGYLQKYRQWRCYICPDHTGEFADIAVGDPWYREVKEGESGKSLIVVRTKKGKQFLENASAAGAVILEKHDPSMLPRSQPNLVQARGNLAGRIFALSLCGAPVPKYKGMKTWKFWLKELTLKSKLQSIFGTMRRISSKKLKQRVLIRD